MKVIIHGSDGRIGKEITKMLLSGYKNSSLAAAVDRNYTTSAEELLFNNLDDFNGDADCILDFSNHLTTKGLTQYAIRRNIPLVIATTGQTEEELNMITAASKEIPVFLAANMSVGIALLLEIAKLTVKMMPGAEIGIVEKHHNKKLDSPSGTALLIEREIKKVREIGDRAIEIHAIRMGNLVGEHEVIVGTKTETITLKHKAHSKVLFAEGAMVAVEFLIGKPAGLYGMKDLIG